MYRIVENARSWNSPRSPFERGPRMISDACKEAHRLRANDSPNNSPHYHHASGGGDIEQSPILSDRGTAAVTEQSYLMQEVGKEMDRRRTIRFQIVVWYVGPVDVALQHVSMKFRLTIFWHGHPVGDGSNGVGGGGGMKRSGSFIVMKGREQAYEQIMSGDAQMNTFDVPPVTILNAVSYNTMGDPEVTILREDIKLMRWTCLYKATLIQENMKVDRFPHDEHDLCLKLGILEHRQPGSRWDKSKWKLGLADERDSQKTIRVPRGLLVDHVKVPDFTSSAQGLQFHFAPLRYGAGDETHDGVDTCLVVKLRVMRDSAYYDKNIMPLLATLNIVAVSTLTLDSRDMFKRGLMILNITFVEIGIRMTVDSHLPSVGYQIKMQRILNHLFIFLLLMVFESCVLYYMVQRTGLSIDVANDVDFHMGCFGVIHTCVMLLYYYKDSWDLAKKKNLTK